MDLSQHDSFRKQIAEATSSLHSFLAVRRVLDEKIEDLRALIRANANFLPDAERTAELIMLEVLRVPTTITEAVKLALFSAMAKNETLTPVQIKERAEERGFDFSSYTNPMASIHTILKRLRDATPPQVAFNEKDGTYATTEFIPIDIADSEFYNRVAKKAWMRAANLDREWAHKVTGEEVLNLIESLTKRKGQKREI
jgi:hypothetical protein